MKKIRNINVSGNCTHGYAGPVESGRGGSRKCPENFSGAAPPQGSVFTTIASLCKGFFKNNIISALFLAASLLLMPAASTLFTACENTGNPGDDNCICETDPDTLFIDGKDCECKATNCACPKVYNNTPSEWTLDIPVYRKGAKVESMEDILKNVQSEFNALNDPQRGALLNKWLSVYITAGKTMNPIPVNSEGNRIDLSKMTLADKGSIRYVIEFGEDMSQLDLLFAFEPFMNDIMDPNKVAQIRPANGTRMAAAPAAKQLQKIRS